MLPLLLWDLLYGSIYNRILTILAMSGLDLLLSLSFTYALSNPRKLTIKSSYLAWIDFLDHEGIITKNKAKNYSNQMLLNLISEYFKQNFDYDEPPSYTSYI
ncbi:MAG: hypothetical protein ACXAB7_09585 [Candidatus Kariarchaeaceae archaeon]|jgi:hypothetical protein